MLCILSATSFGATWYVRPSVFTNWSGLYPVPQEGVYGSQDGTTYANAWNGIRSVVWGVGGVTTGDTLYICGTHIATYIAGGSSPNTASYALWLTNSGITLRGDYQNDPALIFGGCSDQYNTYTWLGPDANGVYRSQIQGTGNASWFTKYWLSNGVPVRLNRQYATTWAGDEGAFYSVESSTNYIKLPGGVVPNATNIALSYLGWQIGITNGTSNIVFYALSF